MAKNFIQMFKEYLTAKLQAPVTESNVNELTSLLIWISVVRLTCRPDMTLDVYRRCKTTMQQQQQQSFKSVPFFS